MTFTAKLSVTQISIPQAIPSKTLSNQVRRFKIASARSNPVAINQVRLPDPYPSADLILISPKIELTLNKKLFWSTLVQYSNQTDNLGINSRLQWRFAPLSDLFLVYNDNYYTREFGPVYRSINLKVTYWLSL